MARTKEEILQGTLDLLVLKTLDTLRPCTAMASRGGSSRSQAICFISTKALSTRRCCNSSRRAGLRPSGALRKAIAGRKQLAAERESWGRMAGIIGRLLEGAEGGVR